MNVLNADSCGVSDKTSAAAAEEDIRLVGNEEYTLFLV